MVMGRETLKIIYISISRVENCKEKKTKKERKGVGVAEPHPPFLRIIDGDR